MTSNHSLCDVAGELASSNGYKIVLIAKIFVCVIGVFVFSCYVIFKPAYLWHHVHARICAKYHLVSAFFFNMGSLGILVFNLTRLTTISQDPCSYLIDPSTKFWLSFIFLFLLFQQTVSLLLLAVERTVSTARISSYENCESRVHVLVIVAATSAAIFTALITTMLRTSELSVYREVEIMSSTQCFYVLLAIIVVLGIITVILAQITYLLNVKYRRSYRIEETRNTEFTNRLSAVFQIEENLSMIRIVLPVSYIHLLIVTFSVAGLLAYDLLDHDSCSNVFDATIKEAMLITPFYSIGLPSVLTWHWPGVFWRVVRVFSCQKIVKEVPLTGVTVVPVAQQREIYFAGLKNTFEAAVTKRRS